MKSSKHIVLILVVLAATAAYGVSAYSQSAKERMNRQLLEELMGQPRPPAQEKPNGQPPQVDDLAALKAQVERLHDRVNKPEKEVKDLRTPKIIPAAGR